MKKLILLISVLLLTACASSAIVPVTLKFPSVPDDLKAACPDLEQIDPDTKKLSQVLTVVGDNYSQYYECKAKVDNWIEWYNSQQQIYDKVSK